MKPLGPYFIYEEQDRAQMAQKQGLTHVGQGRYKKTGQEKNPEAEVYSWSGSAFVKEGNRTAGMPKPAGADTVSSLKKPQEQPKGQQPQAGGKVSDQEFEIVSTSVKDPKPEITKDGIKTGGDNEGESAAAHQEKGAGGVPTGRSVYKQEELQKLLRGLQASGQKDKDGKLLTPNVPVDGVPASKFDLCTVTVEGSNMFCGNIPKSKEHPDGIPRGMMPQLKTTPKMTDDKGQPTRAAQLIKSGHLQVDPKSGEINAQPYWDEWLTEKGYSKKLVNTDPMALKATQAELSGEKVSGMMGALEKGKEGNPAYDAITAPIYVSPDGYILDGHHRWAAIVAYNNLHPDAPIPMQVEELQSSDGSPIDAMKMVDMANQFQDEFGLERKKAGETSGQKK